jgi:hypothetical protein
MKRFSAILLALLFASTAGPALAGSGTTSTMQKPQCASGDPVVGVNMTTKTYMTHAQMKAKAAGMTKSQAHAAMEKSNMKLMCKSQAVKMGAKPATSQ